MRYAYACPDCKVAIRESGEKPGCPSCGKKMFFLGVSCPLPKRIDSAAWKVIEIRARRMNANENGTAVDEGDGDA